MVEGMPASGPSPVRLRERVGERVPGGPAKIATDQDSPSAPVHSSIWQRCADPHPNPLPFDSPSASIRAGYGQGEGIQKVLASNSTPALFTPHPVFRQSRKMWQVAGDLRTCKPTSAQKR